MVSGLLRELVGDNAAREKMKAALVRWDAPKAAEQIAGLIWQSVSHPAEFPLAESETTPPCRQSSPVAAWQNSTRA